MIKQTVKKVKKWARGVIIWYRQAGKGSKVLVWLAAALLFLAAYSVGASFAVRPAEILLLRLRLEMSGEGVCRESCQERRFRFRESIAQEIKARPQGRVARLSAEYFQDSRLSESFRQELVRIWQLSNPNQSPDFLLAALASDATSPVLRAAILANYRAGALGGGHDSLAVYFPYLAKSEEVVWRSALAAISSYPRKDEYDSWQLGQIRGHVFDASVPAEKRRELILLLSDYYPYFPAETEQIWEAVYRSGGMDSISRLFSADLLNRRPDEGLAAYDLPPVTEEEWNEYFNN